jgi:hypothetical protein
MESEASQVWWRMVEQEPSEALERQKEPSEAWEDQLQEV